MRPRHPFHLAALLSACCWHHYLNTNTVFLSSSPGHSALLIFLFLLQPLEERRWGPEGIWDVGELWETRAQSVASQRAALSSSSLAVSLDLFWQRITGGSMQITCYALKRSGKARPVDAFCIYERRSALKRRTVCEASSRLVCDNDRGVCFFLFTST